MPSAQRPVVIGTRTSRETKTRFAALAAQQDLTESALLALLVENVLAAQPTSDSDIALDLACDEGRANDRLTIRLRPGDRALAAARAARRRMKTASYLSMLVRTHVRGTPVMPPAELDELKAVAGHLAAIGRQLRSLNAAAGEQEGAGVSSSDALLRDVGNAVENVRETVASVVRTNLISWECGNA
ncbi:hypothetical protein J7E70_33390 [Variovorax paradoxus]|nr:hypothetical protein [Variovorax paradoxus]MBT2305299.1 hypothetical protein [Variovorax paradoxus]